MELFNRAPTVLAGLCGLLIAQQGYAAGLVEGQAIKRGDLLGYVGVTGNADPLAPHLHFAVFVLGPEKHWWKGTAINPYPLFAR